MLWRAGAALVVTVTVVGCRDGGSDPAPQDGAAVIDPGDGGRYAPRIDPAAFSNVIDHPYLPLAPGMRWEYESTDTGGATQRITVEVTDQVRTVMGIETVVVHDVVTEDGAVVEDTFDWFAQDATGNVWYFGEDTTSYDGGEPSKEGSWEAGVDGALPGIVMPARPAVTGLGYRQEYLAGEAEDMGQVIATSGSADTPDGRVSDVVVTRDWTPLEPDVVEEKTYARGIGLVGERDTAGGSEVVTLVAWTPAG